MTGNIGLVGFGAYLPALRLPRKKILDAHGWLNPALAAFAKGELAVCNWDEDALTMAVEAARVALPVAKRGDVDRLMLASTTLPFEGRLGGALLTEALGLPADALCLDAGGGLRSGLTAVRLALESDAPQCGLTLCVASDRQQAKPASIREMSSGSGAAALLLGRDKVLARYLGATSHTTDFVDRFRPRDANEDIHSDTNQDIHWEDRWVREEGYLKIIPETVRALLGKLGMSADDVHHLVIPVAMPGVAAAAGAAVGIPGDRVTDNLSGVCGDVGSAYSLLLLISALERAQPGERILVTAFGQGCEALLFEATGELAAARAHLHGTGAALSRRLVEANYLRHLVAAGQLAVDTGLRGAAQGATPLSVAYRERRALLGFTGGRCPACGTLQFPRAERCVNPGCHAGGPQDAVSFAERTARILTWTADRLAYTPRPPLRYGMVEFDGGGRVLMEFADVGEQPLDAGMPLRMVFRLRRPAPKLGYRSYFWKAAPLVREAAA